MDVEVSDATFLAANMTLQDDFQFPFRRTEMQPYGIFSLLQTLILRSDEKVSWDICVIPQATGRFIDFPVMMRFKVDGGESAGISLDEAGYIVKSQSNLIFLFCRMRWLLAKANYVSIHLKSTTAWWPPTNWNGQHLCCPLRQFCH